MSGYESQLIVAVHDGVGVAGDQQLTLFHYRRLGEKPYAFRTMRYPLSLSVKAELEWLGFTFEGKNVQYLQGKEKKKQNFVEVEVTAVILKEMNLYR